MKYFPYGSNWQYANIGSGNGLRWESDKPLAEPMNAYFKDAHVHLWLKWIKHSEQAYFYGFDCLMGLIFRCYSDKATLYSTYIPSSL